MNNLMKLYHSHFFFFVTQNSSKSGKNKSDTVAYSIKSQTQQVCLPSGHCWLILPQWYNVGTKTDNKQEIC